MAGELPDGQTFVSGLFVNVVKDSAAVNPLPAASNLLLEFQIPAGGEDGDFAVLFWDDTKWVAVDPQQTANGYFQLNSIEGGTFILVKK